MSSTYEIILNNNHNILFTVDSVGTISIDDLSLKDPKFLTIELANGAMKIDESGNMDMSGDLVIEGSLTAKGTKTQIFTTNKYIKDSIIELGNGTSGTPSNDAGFIIERGDSSNTAFSWIENPINSFVLGLTDSDSSNSTIKNHRISIMLFPFLRQWAVAFIYIKCRTMIFFMVL